MYKASRKRIKKHNLFYPNIQYKEAFHILKHNMEILKNDETMKTFLLKLRS